jgi:hypothetical protein
MAEEEVKIDMEAANREMSDSIVQDLGGEPAKEVVVDEGKPAAAAGAAVEKPVVRAVPKSWKPEYHEAWGKLDPKVQEYVGQRENEMASGIESVKGDAAVGRTLKEVIAPYQPLLDSQGIREPAQAVRALLNAHYQLSTADEAGRTALFASLAKQYHVDVAKLAGAATATIDPALREVTDRLNKVEGSLTAAQQAQVEGLRQQTSKEVEVFASDPTHPYFNEVADHIVLLLQDPRISLKDAYEQAVWANPATRAKEQARLQQEAEAKLRKDAEEAAAKARKAKGTDVRGKESSKSSTELLGTMEDTMRDTYREINSRT